MTTKSGSSMRYTVPFKSSLQACPALYWDTGESCWLAVGIIDWALAIQHVKGATTILLCPSWIPLLIFKIEREFCQIGFDLTKCWKHVTSRAKQYEGYCKHRKSFTKPCQGCQVLRSCVWELPVNMLQRRNRSRTLEGLSTRPNCQTMMCEALPP